MVTGNDSRNWRGREIVHACLNVAVAFHPGFRVYCHFESLFLSDVLILILVFLYLNLRVTSLCLFVQLSILRCSCDQSCAVCVLLVLFYSVVKIRRVQTVVLVIHGTEDEVIDFSHGLCIYERAPNTVDPLWIEGAGHNDVEQYRSYLVRLQKFVDKELPARAAAAAAQAAQREAEAAAAEAVAVASRQASGEDVAHAAVGDDGVMVLSGQFEDDETESANDRDVADGSVKKSSRTPSPRPSSVAGSFGKLDADKAIPSNASQTSALPIDTASDDVLEGKSTEELLPVNPSPMSSTDRHTPAKNSSMSRSEDDQSTASTTQQAARTASQTSLPLSSDLASTPLPDEQEVADMTVVTRDGGRKTLASLAPTESLTLVYV